MFGHSVIVMLTVVLVSAAALAEYQPTPHRPLAPGAIAVTAPGNLDQPGATYQLMNDVTSDRTALFLAKDVTLDLNGYTVTYAKGAYEHVPNCDFEQDFTGFDTTGAPNAKIRTMKSDWPWVGTKVCRLPKGEEIVSSYVTLPVADRSYHATVAILTDTAPVTISVEDEAGKPVTYEHHVGTKSYQNCPISAASKLDGGCVYAHFRGAPAGKYRVRVKAGDEDLTIDHVDIRPSLDAGVVLADTGWVYANYNQVAWGGHTPVLVDYLAKNSYNQLADGVTTAKGNTQAVIRNGVIRNGTRGMHSWGIVAWTTGTVVLENVKMEAAGINTNQVIVSKTKAVVRDCRFETDTPFIIERHNVVNSPVAVGDVEGTEVSHCEFIGGQGNLHTRGPAKIHHNLFVNRQRVTNHYALTLGGATGAEVYENRFEPEIGCGINMYRAKDCVVRNNTFKVDACDRSCEVYRGAGTVTGVRITDYNAKKGDPKGCWGNRVHDNKFLITGKAHDAYGKESHGRAVGIFYSSGGGENFVTNNEFTIVNEDPASETMVTGFYVGAADFGGVFEGNRITANVPAFYIAAGYGPAGNVVVKDNTFIKGPNAAADYQPIRMGYWILTAENVQFRSNTFQGAPFGIQWGNTDTKDKKHSYSVSWTLTVKAAAGSEVVVTDKDGKEAFRGKTGADGTVSTELLEYRATAAKTGRDYTFDKTYASPYKVKVGAVEKTVTLDHNTELAF